jgi:hypothetical protein
MPLLVELYIHRVQELEAELVHQQSFEASEALLR